METVQLTKSARIAAAVLGASLVLVCVLAFVGNARIEAAPHGPDRRADPAIEAITFQASLPISDTGHGAAITKTVYFNNSEPGVLTLTLQISGTPPVTLTTGAAFASPERTMSSTNTRWSPAVTYSVVTGAMTYRGVTYTVVNTYDLHTVAVSYTRDVTAPSIVSPSVAEISDYICTSGSALYYTNWTGPVQAFEVRGFATDSLAGLRKASFSEAFENTPDNDLSPSSLLGIYNILGDATETGTITAAVDDWVDNTAIQTFTYDLDNAAPYTGNITIGNGRAYISQTEVVLSLFTDDAGCGVEDMCLGNKPQCSEWEDYATPVSRTLDPGDGLKTMYVQYRDRLHNASGWYTDSVLLDTVGPTVAVTAPTYTTATTFVVSWGVTDPVPGSDVVPSYTVEVRQDGGAWSWLTATTQLSISFSGAQAGHVYDFRISAQDRVGNSSESTATTRVGPWRVFLPLVLHTSPPPWTQAAGTDEVSFYDIAICPDNVDLQYAGTTDDGLYRSIDGGKSWEHWALEGWTTPVVVNPTDCSQAFAAVWGRGVHGIIGHNQTVTVNQGLDEWYLYSLAISDDGQTLYAGTNTQGVYRTRTSDINWEPINTGISDPRIRSLYVISDTLYAGSRKCRYYYSENDGDSWSEEVILSGGQGGLCEDAQVWAVEQMGNVSFASLGGDKGLYRRSEGGNWARVIDVPAVTIYRFGLHHRFSRLFVGTFGYGAYACDQDGHCQPLANRGLGTSNLRGLTGVEAPNTRLLAGSDDGIWWVSVVP